MYPGIGIGKPPQTLCSERVDCKRNCAMKHMLQVVVMMLSLAVSELPTAAARHDTVPVSLFADASEIVLQTTQPLINPAAAQVFSAIVRRRAVRVNLQGLTATVRFDLFPDTIIDGNVDSAHVTADGSVAMFGRLTEQATS